MITVIDRMLSEESGKLRRTLLLLGYPCRLIKASDIKNEKGIYIRIFDGEIPAYEERSISVKRNTVSESVVRKIVDRADEILETVDGFSVYSFSAGRFYIKGNSIFVCGSAVTLSETERKILLLLSYYNDAWLSTKSLAEYCFEKTSEVSVRVAVSSVNKKLSRITYYKVTETKRGKGYRIH